MKTANIDIRVTPEFLAKIDAWRATQRVMPSRAAAVQYMIEDFLARDEEPKWASPKARELARGLAEEIRHAYEEENRT
jgi:hypothetical protein